MLKKSELLALHEKAMLDAVPVFVTLSKVEYVLFPWKDFTKRAISLGLAHVVQVTISDKTGKAEQYSVVIGFNGSDWGAWCGDQFLNGILDSAEADRRIGLAAGGVPNAVQQLAQDTMKRNLGRFKTDGVCDFWKMHKPKIESCQHVLWALSVLTAADFEELETLHAQWKAGICPMQPSSAPNRPSNLLSRYAGIAPVLLRGPRGIGKTHLAMQYALENNYPFVLIQCNRSTTAADLLGHYVTSSEAGKLVFKNGELSEFFHLALTQPVVLIIDEILRADAPELSIFINAFSLTHRNTYILKTGRMVGEKNGIGTVELLEIPAVNAIVVATTNLGSGYQVEEMDRALRERFVIEDLDLSLDSLKSVIIKELTNKNYSVKQVDPIIKFHRLMKTAYLQGDVADFPTLRTTLRAIKASDTEDEIQHCMADQSLAWVADNTEGTGIAEQLDTIKQLLAKCWN